MTVDDMKTGTTAGKFFTQAFFCKDFLYDFRFPLLVAVWVFFCYALNIQTAGLAVMIVAACFILVFCDDMTPIMPLFADFLFLIRDYSALLSVICIVCYVLLVICLVFHFIRFPVKNFRLGKLFFPLCLVSFALLLGGTFSPFVFQYASGLATVIATGPLLIIIYLVFLNGINAPEKVNIAEYVCYVIVLGTACACLELVTFGILWGNSNAVATAVLIAFPACTYLMLKPKNFVPSLILALFLLFSLFESKSDGCIGIFLISAPFLIAFTILRSEPYQRKYLTLFTEVLIIVLCAAGFTFVLINGADCIIEFIILHTDPNGRPALIEKAVDCFIKYPLTGVGQGYSDATLAGYNPNELQSFNFHSVIFHVPATMGVFGIIAYAIYYFTRFKIICGRRANLNVFVFFSFALFTAYATIDTVEFNVIPLMSYITLLILVTEKLNGVNFYDANDGYSARIKKVKFAPL